MRQEKVVNYIIYEYSQNELGWIYPYSYLTKNFYSVNYVNPNPTD